MNETPKLMTHERIMTGEEYVSYSDYLSLQRERDEAKQQEQIHYDNFLSMQKERDKERRELQLLLESTKVEACSEPLPERGGEPADFAGAIRRMRLAEEERDQWRECAERLSAFVVPVPADMADHTACATALAEFERLKEASK